MSVAWSSNDQEVIERSLEEHLNNSQRYLHNVFCVLTTSVNLSKFACMSIAFSLISKSFINSGIKEDADESEIKDIFEVERCVAWIKKHDLHNVTLQFPDKLLQYAPVVAKQLGESLSNRR